MYVIDTDVISRTSPLSRDGVRVGSWLQTHGDESFLSALTLTELHFGAFRLHLAGATRQARAVGAWIDSVTTLFKRKLLQVDAAVAQRSGELLAVAERAGIRPGVVDACIAATAEIHGYEVVTFNKRHFAAFGIPFRAPGAERP